MWSETWRSKDLSSSGMCNKIRILKKFVLGIHFYDLLFYGTSKYTPQIQPPVLFSIFLSQNYLLSKSYNDTNSLGLLKMVAIAEKQAGLTYKMIIEDFYLWESR